MENLHPDVDYVMLSAEELDKRVKELATQMDKLYEGRKPVDIILAAYESSRTNQKVELV